MKMRSTRRGSAGPTNGRVSPAAKSWAARPRDVRLPLPKVIDRKSRSFSFSSEPCCLSRHFFLRQTFVQHSPSEYKHAEDEQTECDGHRRKHRATPVV